MGLRLFRVIALELAALTTGVELCLPLDAQARPQPKHDGTTPSFEVASVKPSGPQSVRNSEGGPGSGDPERFSFTKSDLRDLIFIAYGLKDYEEQISGPRWIDTENYDVAVKIPRGTTRTQFRQMFQALLAERFKLVVRHETKQLPVFDLVVGKNGPKIEPKTKESSESSSAAAQVAGPSDQRDQDGFPVLPAGHPGFAASMGPGRQSRWTAQQQTMSALVEMLSGHLAAGRRVVDKTGLTGKYDFHLAYDMELAGAGTDAPEDGPALSIFDAVEKQLGLKLVPGKAPFEVIHVVHAEKIPVEN